MRGNLAVGLLVGCWPERKDLSPIGGMDIALVLPRAPSECIRRKAARDASAMDLLSAWPMIDAPVSQRVAEALEA